MSDRGAKTDEDVVQARRDAATSVEIAPGRYASADLVGKGAIGPKPKVPGKRTASEALPEVDDRPLESGVEASPESNAPTAQADHNLEYGAGDTSAVPGRSAGRSRGDGPAASAARESFEVQNWGAHRNTALTSDLTNGGSSFLVQQGGIAARANVRALTPDAQRYSVGFVQTMHGSTRRAIYVDDNGVVRNTFVATRGTVMDQRTDISSPPPWYNYGLRLGDDARAPAMSDNPTFEVPAAASGDAFLDRFEGSESFTTYLVVMVGDDPSTIIYLGNVRWDVNWAGRVDGTTFLGRDTHVGGATTSAAGGAVLTGPAANHGSMGRFTDGAAPTRRRTAARHGGASGYAYDDHTGYARSAFGAAWRSSYGDPPAAGAPTTPAAATPDIATVAAAVPARWRPVLGGLLPAAGSTSIGAGPNLDEYKRGIYGLLRDRVAGDVQAEAFLALVPADRQTYRTALPSLRTDELADRAHVTTITNVVSWFRGHGDVPTAQQRLVPAHAMLTATGKQWLARQQVVRDLDAYASSGAHSDGMAEVPSTDTTLTRAAAGERRQNATRAIARMLRNEGELAATTAPGAAADTTGQLTAEERAEQERLYTELRGAITTAITAPPRADGSPATPVAELNRRTFEQLQTRIRSAPAAVRDRVLADTELMRQLNEHLNTDQMSQLATLTRSVDSVDELYERCTGRTMRFDQPRATAEERREAPLDPAGRYALIRTYLLARPGDQNRAARQRLLGHARFMDDVYERLGTENQQLVMRMISRGTLEPTPEDRVNEACTSRNGAQLVQALLHFAGADRPGLLALRDNQVFRTNVQRASEDIGVVHAGDLDVQPFDLLLQLWGQNPTDTSDPAGGAHQREVNPDSATALPLNDAEHRQLNDELFAPTVQPLANELNSTMWISDATVTRLLSEFEVRAAREPIRALLRRGQIAPGPELERRVNAVPRVGSVRQKLQAGCSDDVRAAAERVLGIRVDAAAVGVVDGVARTQADENAVTSGQSIVPLAQALRETMCGSQTLSQYIHGKAAEMATELDESWASGYADADDVLRIWRGLVAGVNPHVENLQRITGIARIHPIELFANAYAEIGTGSLESKLNSALDAEERTRVLPDMGMTPRDVQARTIQHEQNLANTEEGRAAAHTAAEATEWLAQWQTKARELWDLVGRGSQYSRAPQLEAIKAKRDEAMALRRPDGARMPAPVVTHDRLPGERVGGPAGSEATANPTTFADLYNREYGLTPDRHLLELVRLFPDTPPQGAAEGRLTRREVAEYLGVDAAAAGTRSEAAPSDTLVIDESNRHLVRPDFDIEQARTRAREMWRLLHEPGGQVQMIVAQVEGRTQEEQRLIHMAFRQLSGGIELRFYLQQARSHVGYAMQMGAAGSEAGHELTGDRRVGAYGSTEELDAAVALAQTGRIDLDVRLRAACRANDMDSVYRLVEDAGETERRAILANSEIMGVLRGQADDQYEWDRVYRALTGQSDLVDRLQSRAHGEHGILGGMFDNTDEGGMRRDIQAYMRQRRAAIRRELETAARTANPDRPETVGADAVNARLREDCQRLMANPDVRAIIEAELSGFERSQVEGMIGNSGEENPDARVLTDGDATEDETQIIASIRQMTPAVRRQRLDDPAYMARLMALCDTEEYRRDAMNALTSDAEPSGEDRLAALEQASRRPEDVSTDMRVQVEDVLQNLAHLSHEEYRRLLGNPALMAQVMAAVRGDPTREELVRNMLAYRDREAAQRAGITAGAVDGVPGEIPQSEVERLAYQRFNAMSRMRYACNIGGWDTLLSEAVSIYSMNFRPAIAAAAPAGGDAAPSAPAAPDAAPAATQIRDAAQARERTLRDQLWQDVHVAVEGKIRALQESVLESRSELSADTMIGIIRDGVKGINDPTGARLDENAGLWDDNAGIESTIRNASADRLIRYWTTVKAQPPGGGQTLETRYQRWQVARQRVTEARGAAGGAGANVAELSRAEREARIQFQSFVIDTSQLFEDQLLEHSGGLFADARPTQSGQRPPIRDNPEFLEWRTLVRDRIPNLESDRIAEAIGIPDTDTEARGLIQNGTRTALTSLAAAEENYEVNRGEVSNPNMDRLTAGAEGQRLDRAIGDYRAEVGNSIVSEDPRAYGEISEAEQGRIDAARAEFDESLGAFRAAKQRVADLAAAIVAVVITLLVTIFTAGTATGPLVAILLGAATGAAAGAGSALTREALLGSGYELGREGVQEVITQAATGALTAGAQFYAGALIRSMTGAGTAAQQLTSIGATALTRPPLWQRVGLEMLEEGLQTGLEGTVEAGAAAIDPTHWMHGWQEGWRRGRDAGLTRLSQVPAESARAAAVAGITQLGMAGAGAARDRLGRARRGPVDDATRQAEEAAERQAREAGDDASSASARARARGTTDVASQTDAERRAAERQATTEIGTERGPRASLGERARQVGGAAIDGIGESAAEAVAERALSEETWRAEGAEARAILGDVGMNILESFKDVAHDTHVGDANVARRSRSGAVHLAREGHRLTPTERAAYIRAVVHAEDAGPNAMSVGVFLATRNAAIDAAIARHERRLGQPLSAPQRDAFRAHVRSAASEAELQQRLQTDPASVPAVAGADADAARRAEEARVAEEERNPGPAVSQLLAQLGRAITQSTAAQETGDAAASEAERQTRLASAAMTAIPPGRGGAHLASAIAALQRATAAYDSVVAAQQALVLAHRDLQNARTRLQAALDILNNAAVTPDRQAAARAELVTALRAETAELARAQQAVTAALAQANAGVADARLAVGEAEAARRQVDAATAAEAAAAATPASTPATTPPTPATTTPATTTPATAPATTTPATAPATTTPATTPVATAPATTTPATTPVAAAPATTTPATTTPATTPPVAATSTPTPATPPVAATSTPAEVTTPVAATPAVATPATTTPATVTPATESPTVTAAPTTTPATESPTPATTVTPTTTQTPATDVAPQRALPATADEARERRAAGEQWSNGEVRAYYNARNGEIASLDQEWQAQGASLEERARRASELRHGMRMTARAMMSDSGQVLELLIRDAVKYGDGEGPTFEQLVAQMRRRGFEGDAIYEQILRGSQRTDRATTERVEQGEAPPGVPVPEGVTIRGDYATVQDASGADVVIRIKAEDGTTAPRTVRLPDGTFEVRFGKALPASDLAPLVAAELATVRAQASGDIGASSGMADTASTYRGGTVARNNAHNVRAGVTDAMPGLAGLFPPGAVRVTGPNLVEITDRAGVVHEVRIVVADGSLPVATDVANYDLRTTPITVTISGTIRKEHVARALGHEISEIRSVLEQRAGGPVRSTTRDALGRDSTETTLSHDDMGRVGELRVLMNELTTSRRPRAETRAEIGRLLRALGMLNTDGTAFNTGGLGGQRQRLMQAEGIDFAALGSALGFAGPAAPRPSDPSLPLRGEHADPAAVPRVDITPDDVRPLLRPDIVAAFVEFGLSEETVIQYIVDHHNERSRQRYLPDLEGLARQHAPALSLPDVMLIDLYTTKLFYKELNSRLRGRTTRERDAALRLARLLNASLTRLPAVTGTAYRSINLTGGVLTDFLAEHVSGASIRWTSYSSVASELAGTMPGDNIVFIVNNAVMYDITDFADGMAYKDPPNPGREMLIPAGAQLRVISATEVTPGKWHIVLEQTGAGSL